MRDTTDHNSPVATACPECGQTGQPVQGQTVKALLAVTLRAVRDADYLFCRAQTCPVVYFSSDGRHSFTVGDVRERVFQKEPEAADMPICYCFRHTVGDLRTGSAEARAAILEDINTGIEVGQCACDLRNPQGSCCLGNVRILVRQFDRRVTTGS
jgi:Zinc binding domain